ncbi:xylulokinase [Candidatus Chlorohelix sp.]|uniref:xylulokinase n=1 Tax=Candidatus Chlorohelix sp. TaxID=3139201 RepID=UPI00303BFE2D
MSYFMGIDLGTTSARAIIVDGENGQVVAAGTSEYPLYTPQPLWAEQDPADWWCGTIEAVKKALFEGAGKLGKAPEIVAIGLSGQMHGVVLLDEEGEILGPSLIWCDGRAQAQCDYITEEVGAEKLIELTANPAIVGFSAPKLIWLREHCPDQFLRAAHFLLPKDFIRYKLTGEFASEVSDASGTLLFDVANRKWSEEMCHKLEIDSDLLPDVYESTVVSGQVSPQAAAQTGLRAGTPVVGGGGDQAAGAVGNGIVRAGLVSSAIGSSGVVFAHSAIPALDPGGRVHTFCHAVPGSWHVMGVTQGAGISLRWFRDEIAGRHEIETALVSGTDIYEILTRQAAEAPAGSEGLIFLPYLMGERTPHLDPQARGVWFGLTAAHRRSHLVRSVLEGVSYSLKDCLSLLEDMGLPIEEIRASGGGGKSQLWRQIQADMFEREVVTINATEGPAYGAALLAGVGTGFWKDVGSACDSCIQIRSRTAPIHANSEVYRRYYPLYKEIYIKLKPLYRQL